MREKDALTQIIAGGTSMGKEQKPNQKIVTSADIDAGPFGLVGQNVFYQLRDEDMEGTPVVVGGLPLRKVPAKIVMNYYGRRDASKRLVFAVMIFRPDFLGGVFSRDEVPFDSSREPGTIDKLQPGDLAN